MSAAAPGIERCEVEHAALSIGKTMHAPEYDIAGSERLLRCVERAAGIERLCLATDEHRQFWKTAGLFPHRRCETRKPVRLPAHVLRESNRRKAALPGAFKLLGDCGASISPRGVHLEFHVHQFRLEIAELNEVLLHRFHRGQGAAFFLVKNCCSPTGIAEQR
jgi:hypothetical protein